MTATVESEPRPLDVYPGVTLKGATFSPCGLYRYTLRRAWGNGLIVAFVGLNPSTADAREDDPTIRRCTRFARDWGFDGMVMLNLFALRSTDPHGLLGVDDPVGPGNDAVIAAIAQASAMVVGAWGAFPLAKSRAADVVELVGGAKFAVLGTTKDGQPRHPLYMPASTRPAGGLFMGPAMLPVDLQRVAA